jgi:hypothetical protein
MTPPIQLSLAGDGKFLILTPATVRKAYFQFVEVNPEYSSAAQKHRLKSPLYQKQDLTLIDVLYRKHNIEFHPKDIRHIERELNQQIVEHKFSLVAGEGQLLSGYGLCNESGQSRKKVQYIIRYGLIFILEPTTKSKMISMKNTDLFWQDRNFDFHYVRYVSLLSSYSHHHIELLFRDRLNLAKSWTCSIEEFKPRQLFTISAIYPSIGFSLYQT